METRVTAFQTHRNLSIVQFATSHQDSFDYIGCGNAFSENLITVNEMDDAGSVNSIFVLNNSESYVFMMDGDILAGAKQNRVVNTSILLDPQSKTKIPVSCVEQGRWRHTSPSFKGTNASAPMCLRASKASQVKRSLKQQRGFASDQGEIWGKVDQYQTFFQVASHSGNLSDIYEQKANEFDELLRTFVPDSNANGMAVFFGKTLAGLDVFNRKDVYLEYFSKLLRGAALEAEALPKKSKGKLTEPEARYRTLELLDSIETQQFEDHKGVGVGVDRRFESPNFNGFELVYGSHMIHLAVFKIS